MISRSCHRLQLQDLVDVQCVWGNAVLCRSLASLHACFASGNSPSSAVDPQVVDQPSNSAHCCSRASYRSREPPANTYNSNITSRSSRSGSSSWHQPKHQAHSVPVTPSHNPVQQLSWTLQQQRDHLAPFSRQSWRTWQQQQLCQLPSGFQPPQQQWRSMADSSRPERNDDIFLSAAQQQAAEYTSRKQSPEEPGVTAAAPLHSTIAPQPEWATLELEQQQQQHMGQWLQQQSQWPPQRTAKRDEQQHAALQLDREYIIPVHALHLGAEIDAAGFHEKYEDHFVEAHLQLPPHRDHIIFQLKNSSESQDMLRPGHKQAKEGEVVASYMVVYRYGSVIFINVPSSKERDHWTNLLRKSIKAKEAAGKEKGEAVGSMGQDTASLRLDETRLVVRPGQDEWSKLESDQIVVKTLEMANLRVISHVLSQSVALDYFNSRVDVAIEAFKPYLDAVASSGQCDTVKEAGLLKLIAENSLLYTDVVTKIGLLDISQTAWKQDKHYKLWEALRGDYEIERRFDAINRKLGPMLENAKFLLEVRAEHKSSRAEWIIIGLIMLEVFISGAGHLAHFFVLH